MGGFFEFSHWKIEFRNGVLKLNRIKRMGIGMKFNTLVIGIILVLSVVIGIVSYVQIEKSMMGVYEARVKVVSEIGYNWLDNTYEGDWSIKNGELYKGNTKMNDNNELLEELGTITDGAATIFQGDIRIATNVIGENGERSIGTKVNPTVADIVLGKGETYIGVTDIVGTEHLTMYQPIHDKNGDVIGMWLVGPPITVVGNTIMKLLVAIAIALVITGVIAVVISLFFVRTVVRPIKAINVQLKEISEGEGDLTKELQVNSQDEVGELAISFNRMISSLREMIQQVSLTSHQVAASSDELTASTEQTTEATSQIASSIQEVAAGAEAQGIGAAESSKSMQEISDNIQQIAQTTSTVSEVAVETSKEANEGNESLQKVIHQMKKIHTTVEDTASVIKQLEDRSNEIGNIIEVITEIADQTNLLALNAAIEAARAGENGRGFAVVADEVKKLAEQSKSSADQITVLINQIQNDTDHAVTVMQKGTEEVAVGMEVVQHTGEGFERILASVEHVAGQIQEVSAITEEVAAGAEQINATIEEMSHIANTSSANTQNIAAASEEQMASMEEITSSSASLSKMAEDLQMLVGRFKV